MMWEWGTSLEWNSPLPGSFRSVIIVWWFGESSNKHSFLNSNCFTEYLLRRSPMHDHGYSLVPTLGTRLDGLILCSFLSDIQNYAHVLG